MVSRKSAICIFILSLLVISATACGEDDGNGVINGDYDLGEMKLTVTGSKNAAANGALAGQADFDNGRITSHDFAPQTFSLDLVPTSLAPGTYKIDGDSGGTDTFHVDASLFPDGDLYNPIDFSSVISGGEGTMTITKSTAKEVVGSFDFSVPELDLDEANQDLLDTVHFKGTFRATPTIFL